MSSLAILYLVVDWLVHDVQPGWTGIMATITIFFGILFMMVGMIAEYLYRIFIEAKGRPLYFIAETAGAVSRPRPADAYGRGGRALTGKCSRPMNDADGATPLESVTIELFGVAGGAGLGRRTFGKNALATSHGCAGRQQPPGPSRTRRALAAHAAAHAPGQASRS